jgi:hypothetical protein
MNSAFSTAIPDPSLAAIGQLRENSRLGFASRNPALHRGIEWSKSTLALGLPEWSGKTASDHVVAANNGSFTKAVLPEGPYTNLCHSGQASFLAPASFDFSAVVAAGTQNPGLIFNITAANAAIGQGGTFDYQRSSNSAGDTIFYSGYTNVSNFGVGAYIYGTGLPPMGRERACKHFRFCQVLKLRRS